MNIKSKVLRKIGIKIGSFLRKIYSPIIFYILWVFYIKWKISSQDETQAIKEWKNIYNSTTINEYDDRIKIYNWQSEILDGLLDFTYEKPWINFIPHITNKLGRDCEDFANMTWLWMLRMGYAEIYQILSVEEDIKTGHMICVGKPSENRNTYLIKSNSHKTIKIDAENLSEALTKFYKNDKLVWTIYKKILNR